MIGPAMSATETACCPRFSNSAHLAFCSEVLGPGDVVCIPTLLPDVRHNLECEAFTDCEITACSAQKLWSKPWDWSTTSSSRAGTHDGTCRHIYKRPVSANTSRIMRTIPPIPIPP